MSEIKFKTVPQKWHRYSTIGDYWHDKKGVLQVRVTDMDRRSVFLVLIHELIEQFLTEERGIKEEDIMAFDLEFEKNRKEGDLSEPGDSVDAPYKNEHRFAENIERQIAHEIGYVWNEYEQKINEML